MPPSKREVIHTPKESKFNRDFAILLCIGLVLLVVAVAVICNLIEQENKHVDEVGQIKIVAPTGSQTEERKSDASAVVKKQVEDNPDAESIDFRYIDLSDEAMQHVAKLRRLKTLNIPYTQVSDDGLRYITNLPIEHLNLLETSVTDRGMKYIGQMRELRQLCLLSTHVSDAGLNELKDLEHLGDLNLASTDVTDKGVPTLLPLKGTLWKLDLSDTHVTNACIATLSQMKSLDDLAIGGTDVTVTGLSKHLHSKVTKLGLANTQTRDSDCKLLAARFPQLVRLNLTATKITDEGLLHLVKLKNLKQLRVFHCNVSKSAIAKLEESIPTCQIIDSRL